MVGVSSQMVFGPAQLVTLDYLLAMPASSSFIFAISQSDNEVLVSEVARWRGHCWAKLGVGKFADLFPDLR